MFTQKEAPLGPVVFQVSVHRGVFLVITFCCPATIQTLNIPNLVHASSSFEGRGGGESWQVYCYR